MRLRPRGKWMVVGVAGPVVLGLALVPALRSTLRADTGHGELPSISRLVSGIGASTAPPAAPLAGLDLAKLNVGDNVVTAPLPDKKTARLSVDPALQRVTDAIMTMHHIPEASVVLMDTQTGKVLVYASHVEKGPHRDLAVEATAPSASVFKVVTGSALVEHAGVEPDHRECYSGGEQRLQQSDLVPDPKRDRWCTTVAGAMGRSINTVFARLALQKLKPATLEETAKALGYGSSLPFDVTVQTSALQIPQNDPLGFARTSAGFWNTTLSPVHAAWISATMARGGEPVRPSIVSDVVDEGGKVVWTAPSGIAQARAIKSETAAAVTTMMDEAVSQGTSYRAFHDARGQSFLPGVPVAGKTGTLTDATTQRFYTWFTAFAPSHAMQQLPEGEKGPRQVSIAVLVVNGPTWTVKANVVAREVLRAYFAEQKVANVTPPQLHLAAPSTETAGAKPSSKKGKHAASLDGDD